MMEFVGDLRNVPMVWKLKIPLFNMKWLERGAGTLQLLTSVQGSRLF